MLEEDLLWPWLVIAMPIWLAAWVLRQTLDCSANKPSRFADRYQTLDPQTHLPCADEQKIPIVDLFVFPIQGLLAAEGVDFIDVSDRGVKYDRSVTLMPAHGGPSSKPLVYYRDISLACLRQKMLPDGKVLVSTTKPDRLTAKGLPT